MVLQNNFLHYYYYFFFLQNSMWWKRLHVTLTMIVSKPKPSVYYCNHDNKGCLILSCHFISKHDLHLNLPKSYLRLNLTKPKPLSHHKWMYFSITVLERKDKLCFPAKSGIRSEKCFCVSF